jgi:hypothetical protein
MARPCPVVVEMNGSYLGEVSNEASKRDTDREVHQCYAPFSAECGLFLKETMLDPVNSSLLNERQKVLPLPQSTRL